MRRIRVVRQRDAMQCGVACLSMICGWHGERLAVDTLERGCRPTADGVSLSGIAQAAEKLGMETGAGLATTDSLASLDSPCVLHWNQNHFVVLERADRRARRFRIADPAKGKRWMDRAEFESHWISDRKDPEHPRGIAMTFGPGPDFHRRAESFRRVTEAGHGNPLRLILRYLGKYRGTLAKVAVALLAATILQLILPFLTQQIVDTGIRNRDIGFVWLILLGELAIVSGRTLTDFFRRRVLLRMSMKVNVSLVSDFFVKLLRLPMGFFDTKLSGDLLQRIGDHRRVETFLTGQVIDILFTALSFLVFGTVLLVYDRLIFAVFVVSSVVYGFWTVSFLRRRGVLDLEMFEAQSRNNSRTWQLVTSMQEIKLQGCGGRRTAEWVETQTELFGLQMRSLKLAQTQGAGSVLINETRNILITVIAATAVISGDISLGAMLAVQYVAGQLSSPVEQMMAFVYALQDVRLSLDRIGEVHTRPDEDEAAAGTLHGDDAEDSGPENSGAEESAPAGGGIRVSGVSFRYDTHAPELTLDGIDLDAEPGKVTAIVGASGSGKSTLVKLMLGYYPPERGAIYVGGRPLAEMRMEDWRARCGAVMQEGVIFSDTIARNIAVGDGDVDMERVRSAAATACLDGFVDSLPLGYDTRVGSDGTGLSQGQRQRILIARAVYRDPEFIFLDEATNSLDARNERMIVENLASFYRGRTVVVVAHRLSTVSSADRIVVLDRGRVAETGDHASLTAARGIYYTLVRNQLELG